jgi:glycosyltransferase involved in cell wall biosynthesis
MKIGLIIYGSVETVTGGYLYDRMLISGLRARGDQVEVFSLPERTYGGHLVDNLRYRLASGLDILLQDELCHPSLLLANSHERPYPIISIVHNLRSSERHREWQNGIYRRIEGCYLDSVDGFVFNSTVTRSSVQALVGGAKPHVVATPGGDRLGTATPAYVRERALRGGPLRLLFLANVTAGKGLEVVLDALARLSPQEYTLEVVGSCSVEPEHARKMRVKASRMELPVVFHGALVDQALVEVLQRSGVLVIPSYYEGFGIAYLEGMAHGLPALGTTAGAIPDLITDGVNGYLIAPGDVVTLAERLAKLARDRELLARLSLTALHSFQGRPKWNESVGRVRGFLQDMVFHAEAN